MDEIVGNISDVAKDENLPLGLKIFILSFLVLLLIGGSIWRIFKAYNNSKSMNDEESNVPKTDKENKISNDVVSNENFQAIKLEQKYTSLFAEDNTLKSEKIIITSQHNGTVDGIVTLIERDLNGNETSKFTYSLKGKFSNNILTAEYYSQKGNIDERGAINLKLIDREILSGFCSFSKLSSSVDDEIRVSPYIWVVGENKDLLNGTFDFCTKCYEEHKQCCCANEKVDMPIFLNSEIALIRNQSVKKEKNYFSKALKAPYQNSNVRQMKREERTKPDGTIEYTKCYFYNVEVQKCQIYSGRPLDCRLFPFDIKLSKDKTEYVIGYYTELCNRNLPDQITMKKRAHILRPYFFLLYPYLHIITSDEVCQRLNAADFQEIDNFKDFVF